MKAPRKSSKRKMAAAVAAVSDAVYNGFTMAFLTAMSSGLTPEEALVGLTVENLAVLSCLAAGASMTHKEYCAHVVASLPDEVEYARNRKRMRALRLPV